MGSGEWQFVEGGFKVQCESEGAEESPESI